MSTSVDTGNTLTEIVADLSRELPPGARLQRLLDALMEAFPCDATALLQLEEGSLVPRAVKGLSRDTLGRRFVVDDQPRLQRILQSRGPVRFAADSQLPDPYDGLVETGDHHVHVHDCMGVVLHVDGRVWGVLTLDSLQPGNFDSLDQPLLKTFTSVAAATIRAADMIDALESEVRLHRQVQQSWLSDAAGSEIIGDSDAMVRLLRESEVVARTGLPVQIEGETGVGKELIARHIVRHSSRAERALIQVNCAALPETIAESELFGHERGAFSGASRDRAGRFELAHKGTLFLDEVGELPLSIQAKLLRALQSGELQRVGSDRTHQVDVRVIAATNRDLQAEVAAGRFREDLYHRLSVYPIVVPPLRERCDDVTLLAGYFMERCTRRLGLRGLRLHDAARQWMRDYHWPGNVRELEHAISRAAVRALSEGQARNRVVLLSPRHLGADGAGALAKKESVSVVPEEPELTMHEAMERYKRDLLQRRLQHHGGNIAATARSLGVDRGNLHRQLRRLGLR